MDFGEKVIVCDKCSAKFFVKSAKIEECSVEIEGNRLLLNYFTCPECNQIYRVLLVEEQKYRELVDDLLSIKNRIRRLKGKGNVQMLDKLQKMALIKKNRIQSYVSNMNHKYGGTFTFVASGNNQKEIKYSTVSINTDKSKGENKNGR